MRNTRIDRENGTAGGLLFLVAAIMFFGLVLLIFNPLVAENTDAINDQLEIDSLHHSQEKYDAFNTVLQFWYALPIIFLLAFGFYFWKTSLQERENLV